MEFNNYKMHNMQESDFSIVTFLTLHFLYFSTFLFSISTFDFSVSAFLDFQVSAFSLLNSLLWQKKVKSQLSQFSERHIFLDEFISCDVSFVVHDFLG